MRSGTDKLIETGLFEGFDIRRIIISRTILPIHHDHVFRNVADQIGMMQRDIAPEHQAAVVWLKNFPDSIEVFEVNRADPFCLRFRLALTFAEFERFVGADVKELTREEFVQLVVPIRDELVTARLLGREDIAIGRLCEIGIPLKPQGFVQMAEGLLFGDQLNVIPASICH